MKKISWNDISLKTFQELQTIPDDMDAFSKLIESIAIIEDIDPQDIRDYNISKIAKMREDYKWLNESIPYFDIRKFELNGKWYGFEPDLDLMSGGMWEDINKYMENINDNLHFICAVLFREVTSDPLLEEYTIRKHESLGFIQRAENFKEHLSIVSVYRLVLFFSTLGAELLPITLRSLTNQLNQTMTQ